MATYLRLEFNLDKIPQPLSFSNETSMSNYHIIYLERLTKFTWVVWHGDLITHQIDRNGAKNSYE
jgi:hypothetical protein